MNSRKIVLLVVASVASPAVATAQQLSISPLLLSGDGIDVDGEVRAEVFPSGDYAVNARGDVVVGTSLRGIGSAIVRIPQNGAPEVTAYRGQAPGDLGGLEIDRFSAPFGGGGYDFSLNQAGDVAFTAVYEDPSQPTQSPYRIQQGVFVQPGIGAREPHLVANRGAIASGDNDSVELNAFYDVMMREDGNVTFLAHAEPTQLSPLFANAIVNASASGNGYGLSLGGTASGLFDDPSNNGRIQLFDRLTVNSLGRVVVEGQTIGDELGFLTISNVGIVQQRPGSNAAENFIRIGDPLPNLSDGSTAIQSWYPTQNSRGDVAAYVSAFNAVQDRTRRGIAVYSQDSPTAAVAIEFLFESGSPLSYHGATAELHAIDSFDGRSLVINGRGHIAVAADVDFGSSGDLNGIRNALIGPPRADSDLPNVIAVAGMQVPGRPDLRLISSQSFDSMSLNASGDVVFEVGVTDGSSIGRSAVFLYSHTLDELTLIALEREELEVAPGDVRIIQNVSLADGSGGEDGLPRSLDEAGNVVFHIQFETSPEHPFTTGGLFTARLVVVPEPTGVAVLALGATAWMGSHILRRRRRW